MTWVATAIAGTAILGAVVSTQNSKRAAKAAQSAQEAGQTSSQYYDTLAGISQEEWDLWKNEGLPQLQKLAGMATVPEHIAERESEAATDVRTQAALGRERTQRALGYSRNPGDPGYADIMANTYGREGADVAQAITGARTAERNRVEDTNWARQATVTNLYRGFPAEASAGMSRAAGGQAALAGVYGRQAEGYAGQAAQAGYAAGSGAIWMANRFGQPGGGGGGGGTTTVDPYDYGGSTSGYDPYAETGYSDAAGYGSQFGADSAGLREGGAIPLRRRAYAVGGRVSGPGTGTSDSVSAIKKPGTYVLSADTVRAIGTKKVRDIMEKAGVRPGDGTASDQGGVPVKLSNGEWALPPEVTNYYGEEFFNKLQQKYHRPVFDAEGVANGGAIRRRQLPRSVEDAIHGSMSSQAIRR